MRGIICAGGSGSRLAPLTSVTNKHLLPVYDKPMIYYPLFTLIKAGITEIMIVCSNEHAGPFQRLLGSGKDFGADISFKVQDQAGGIAEALGLCRNFAQGDSVAVILGDNIYADNFEESVTNFSTGCHLFLKQVEDAHRFGVAEVKDDAIVSIEEKPKNPKSDLAVTGLYLYDSEVFNIIDQLDYSDRNELEITDVNNFYVKLGLARASLVSGEWTDAGTFESLYKASTLARNLSMNINPDRKQSTLTPRNKLNSTLEIESQAKV